MGFLELVRTGLPVALKNIVTQDAHPKVGSDVEMREHSKEDREGEPK